MHSRTFKNKTVAVFGLGNSGLSTAKCLLEGGAKVIAWDDNDDRRNAAQKLGASVTMFTEAVMKEAVALVLSPGVPLTHPEPHPVVEMATAAGVSIIGDVEIFLKERRGGRVVGITGTNGKSTTTALIHHMFAHAGRSVAMGGNIGTPVMDLPELSDDGIYVLELSSYQLDLTPSWQADAAVLLNITPDHLDRHGDMAGYAAVKKKVFQHQQDGSFAVLNADDALCTQIARDIASEAEAQQILISTKQRLSNGVSVLNGLLEDASSPNHIWQTDISDIETLRGQHNWQNAAAAVAVCRAMGLSDHEIASGLNSFGGLAHRMEFITEKDGVKYINDSKATNADAAEKSLSAYDNIYWIVGGRGKAGGIAPLAPLFERVTHAYLIGEDASNFALTLEGQVPYTVCGTLDKAVADASAAATSNAPATVLLAPAAASFDQFPSFEARGDRFRELVLGEGA